MKQFRKGKVHNVRLESAAGFYKGTLEFIDGDADFYDRDSMYYPTEELLKAEYPNSKSVQEAFVEAYSRDLIGDVVR